MLTLASSSVSCQIQNPEHKVSPRVYSGFAGCVGNVTDLKATTYGSLEKKAAWLAPGKEMPPPSASTFAVCTTNTPLLYWIVCCNCHELKPISWQKIPLEGGFEKRKMNWMPTWLLWICTVYTIFRSNPCPRNWNQKLPLYWARLLVHLAQFWFALALQEEGLSFLTLPRASWYSTQVLTRLKPAKLQKFGKTDVFRIGREGLLTYPLLHGFLRDTRTTKSWGLFSSLIVWLMTW